VFVKLDQGGRAVYLNVNCVEPSDAGYTVHLPPEGPAAPGGPASSTLELTAEEAAPLIAYRVHRTDDRPGELTTKWGRTGANRPAPNDRPIPPLK
jgi:hypothetical protein